VTLYEVLKLAGLAVSVTFLVLRLKGSRSRRR
jgi:hypothetical protein